ncbi:hypothetical protein [Burkholderia sp. Ac-20344]|uniref:hypothetical protein n=1 Tax=Burkholderia sp. Ac-20344 TaxID=2703890 RepID=UPI00197C994D|nr:hypothetical protein [Burkholderia sp. Ac-20344]MBN3837566.1 hypothetical protein [Burkholderia sp. Ac-20344]
MKVEGAAARLQCIGTRDAISRHVPMPQIVAMPDGFTSVGIRIEASAINQRVVFRPGNNAAPERASQHP